MGRQANFKEGRSVGLILQPLADKSMWDTNSQLCVVFVNYPGPFYRTNLKKSHQYKHMASLMSKVFENIRFSCNRAGGPLSKILTSKERCILTLLLFFIKSNLFKGSTYMPQSLKRQTVINPTLCPQYHNPVTDPD